MSLQEQISTSSPGPIQQVGKEFVDLCASIVDKNVDSPMDAVTFARQLGLTLFQLRRRLVAVTGLTPKEFIARRRVECACRLLIGRPDLTVAEVAQQCGYSDASNFTRAFKRSMGVNPSQYALSTKRDGLKDSSGGTNP